MSIKILLVDDHKVVLRGLELLFNEYNNFQIVGCAQNISEALELHSKLQPNIIITDLSVGSESGIDLIKTIRKENQSVKLIMLTMHLEKNYVEEAISSGANAFISKDADEDELIKAVNVVMEGNSYLSNTISDVLTKSLFDTNNKNASVEKNYNLTKREKEVLFHIVDGLSNKMISTQLKISERTASVHRYNMMKKLDTPNTASLVTLAIKEKLI